MPAGVPRSRDARSAKLAPTLVKPARLRPSLARGWNSGACGDMNCCPHANPGRPARRSISTGRFAVKDAVEEVLARVAMAQDPAIFISLVAPDDLRGAGNRSSGTRTRSLALAALGIPFAVKDNIDVAGSRHDRGLSGLRLSPGKRCSRGRAPESGWSARYWQDQSRPVRDRAQRHPLALWRTPFGVSCGVCVGRIELGFGGRGRGRFSFPLHSAPTRLAQPGCRGVQQYRRD